MRRESWTVTGDEGMGLRSRTDNSTQPDLLLPFRFVSFHQGILAVLSTQPHYLPVIKSSISFPNLVSALRTCKEARAHGVAALANMALRGMRVHYVYAQIYLWLVRWAMSAT